MKALNNQFSTLKWQIPTIIIIIIGESILWFSQTDLKVASRKLKKNKIRKERC